MSQLSHETGWAARYALCTLTYRHGNSRIIYVSSPASSSPRLPGRLGSAPHAESRRNKVVRTCRVKYGWAVVCLRHEDIEIVRAGHAHCVIRDRMQQPHRRPRSKFRTAQRIGGELRAHPTAASDLTRFIAE